MIIRNLIVVLLLSLLAHQQLYAAPTRTNLDRWVSNELTPYVVAELGTKPRFKNSSVQFVILSDDNPQSSASSLALSIRDRMRNAATQITGVRVVWQPDPGVPNAAEAIDCARDRIHYYIGVEVVESSDGQVSVATRALDIDEQTWIAGFNKSWTGYLTTAERRQLHFETPDPSFRGERDAPFDESQFDLLAAHLAYELSCALLRQTDGEYIISSLMDDVDDEAEAAMLELVSNNLSNFRAVQYSSDVNTTNATIEGKAHQVDDDLFQYWVTINPKRTDTPLATLSASAYIIVNEVYATAALIPSVQIPIARNDAGYLSDLKVVEMRSLHSCRSGKTGYADTQIFQNGFSTSAADCYALEVNSSNDTVLFFLNHQLNNGLVRLSDVSCQSRADVRIARANEVVRFPLPADSLMSGAWIAGDDWQLYPDKDSYYVVAATDTKAARALSTHIKKLPSRCTASMRGGVEGMTLESWVREFAAIAENWKQAVDWRVIRVSNVY